MSEKMSFEDVLDELMLEEPKPTYEALVRWCGRYPEYRNELEQFFATWGVQSELPQQVEIDEERLVEKGVNHAMEILRRQGRLIPKDSIEPLQPFDQLVLTAVDLLQGEGNAARITNRVSEIARREVMLGSVFAALARLEKSNLLSVWYTDPETEPEGESRQHFAITLAGERALAHAVATSKAVADFLGEFAL
jgi:hypothetical protein